MAAAATTSLPERAEQGRNYDYRYAWVRDQCYAGQAVAAAGPGELLDAAVGFVAERLSRRRAEMKPAYTVTGGPVPDQRPAGPARISRSHGQIRQLGQQAVPARRVR